MITWSMLYQDGNGKELDEVAVKMKIAPAASDLCLFRNLHRVIDLNTKIAHCALQLRMA